MRPVVLAVLVLIPSLVQAQPKLVPMPEPLPAVKVPATVSAAIGLSTPILIENTPAKVSWTIVPSEGVDVWREHEPDATKIRLRIEVKTTDGKPLYDTYYLTVAADSVLTTCKITVGGPVKPPPPVDPPPVKDDSIQKLQADVSSILTKLTDIAKRMAAAETRMAAAEAAIKGLQKPNPVQPKAAHLTFIGAELTPAGLAVANDAALRDFLKASGVKVHVYRAADPFLTSSGLMKGAVAAGAVSGNVVSTPCVVAQDQAGNIVGAALTTTSDAVKALVMGK